MTEEHTGGVFVDLSGRRGRLVGRVFWLLSCLASAYVVLVLLSLIVPAGLSRLAIPGIGTVVPGTGAPKIPDANGTKQTASHLLAPTSRPAAGPKGLPGASPSPSGRRTTPAVAASPRATAAAASPSPRRTGPPSPHPTAVGASATSHPTPRSTKAASPKPHPTHTPRR
jgi:hypothetical protein